jgi:predicted RNA-binding Zn-ribbon protein involved in translation (DUF1610 family)
VAGPDEEDPLRFRKELEKASSQDLEGTGTFTVPESAPTLEREDDERMLLLDDVVSTVKVQGYDVEGPPPPAPDAEKKALERADPTGDYRRNRKEYRVLCPTCNSKGKCIVCKGRGRRYLILKCPNCEGSGKCPDCGREVDVPCPKCGSPISSLSDSCRKCGHFFACQKCGRSLPALATRCMSCGSEGKCMTCKRPVPAQYTRKCPHCGTFGNVRVVKP